MAAEKVIYSLLNAYEPLTAIVSTRIYAGSIPQDSVLPAIAYDHVSTVEQTSIDLKTLIERSRIQITVAATTYPVVKNIIKLIKSACNNKQGIFNGIKTNSVILELVGPDFKDEDSTLFFQSIDFKVTYTE